MRYLLLVMCAHPFAKEALMLHLARSEGRERYFGCNLTHRKVLASSHQHLMAEAPLLAEQDELRETFLFDGLHPALRERVQIWAVIISAPIPTQF